jgi:hypothetical protein
MQGAPEFFGDYQTRRNVNLGTSRTDKTAFLRQRAIERQKRETDRKKQSASILFQGMVILYNFSYIKNVNV